MKSFKNFPVEVTFYWGGSEASLLIHITYLFQLQEVVGEYFFIVFTLLL